MVDPEKLRQFLGAMRPEFTNVDWTALARKVLVENPQQAWRELPGKLQASRDLLNQYEPGKGIDPRLMDQFMNLTGSFAPMGIFIGSKSKLWDKKAADQFLELEKKNVSPEVAWEQTGTFRGPDKKLRQEISDDKAKANFDLTTQETQQELNAYANLLHGKNYRELSSDQKKDAWGQLELQQRKLSARLNHPDLYTSYKDLADIRSSAMYDDVPRGEYMRSEMFEGSQTVPEKIFETINVGGPDLNAIRSSLLHEAQHAVQRREGFEVGGSLGAANQMLQKDLIGDAPKNPFDIYKRFAGEVEARAVQNRMNMTSDERRKKFPLSSYDVPIEQIIYRSLLD